MRPVASVLASLAAAGAALMFVAASAQDAEEAIDAVIECRTTADAAERLACMDKAAETLSVTRFSTARDEDVGRQAMETPEEFGAEVLPQERAKRAEKKLKAITGKIAEVAVRPNKKVIVTLENGQKWRQLDGDTHLVRFYGKDRLYTATIKRSMFGNYLLIVNELKRSIRVERIE